MAYRHIYQGYSEEQKERERSRAREWHKQNYEKIKARKQAQAREYYERKGRTTYTEGMRELRYRLSRLIIASRTRAKKSGVEHNITLDYVVQLYEAAGGKCCLSGRSFSVGKAQNRTADKDTISIDRIDPTGGYTMGNVRLITQHLNMALGVYGVDEFLKLAEEVAKNYG